MTRMKWDNLKKKDLIRNQQKPLTGLDLNSNLGLSILNFGKHKGKRLSSVPKKYLIKICEMKGFNRVIVSQIQFYLETESQRKAKPSNEIILVKANPGDSIVCFGKFKNEPLRLIPSSYLLWMLDQVGFKKHHALIELHLLNERSEVDRSMMLRKKDNIQYNQDNPIPTVDEDEVKDWLI